jgi:ElaB/YqjD/DUF883 family membrane-anchored ribosome-binding protein
MGQVPDDLKPPIDTVELDAAEAEVDALRDRTQRLVAELERRLRARATQAKEAFDKVRDVADLPLQLRKHPAIAIGVSTTAAVALGVGVYVVVARLVARRRPMARLRARADSVRAFLSDGLHHRPKPQRLGARLIAAVLVAGATALARGLGSAWVRQSMDDSRRQRSATA